MRPLKNDACLVTGGREVTYNDELASVERYDYKDRCGTSGQYFRFEENIVKRLYNRVPLHMVFLIVLIVLLA